MKKLSIALIILIVVLLFGYFAYSLTQKDIRKMNDDKFKTYTLEKSEVKNLLGSEQITQVLRTETITFNQEYYTALYKLNPSCASKINIGETIKTVTFLTQTRKMGAIWILEKNKLACAVVESWFGED